LSARHCAPSAGFTFATQRPASQAATKSDIGRTAAQRSPSHARIAQSTTAQRAASFTRFDTPCGSRGQQFPLQQPSKVLSAHSVSAEHSATGFTRKGPGATSLKARSTTSAGPMRPLYVITSP
jgi:hypothetical protein